ncbi:MAG: ATP-binding protein, partial [Lysinibacillus sp.]
KVGESNIAPATDNSPHLLNYFRQGILLATINHAIVHFNQYTEKMIPKQFLYLGNDVRTLFSEGIIQLEEEENIADLLQRHNSYIGNCTIAGNQMRLIVFFDEKLSRYIYMFEDISELMQLKKQLSNQEYLSEIGKMASTLVHEMRNPMTSIKGYVDLMLMDQQPAMNYMKIIERELTHLTQLCSDILFLSKPIQKLGKGVDLLKVVQEVKQLTDVEVQGTKIDVQLTYDEGSTFIVAGNELYFKQVVLNIVKNAVQAIEGEGLVEIVLRENIHSVQLTVKDNGCGIDKKVLDNVFEMFYTTKEYGTGLGLPVVKKIVEQLNGKVEVKSTIGIGTNFMITIPTFH